MKKQYKVMASSAARRRKLSQQKDMRKISASCSQDVESATVEELQEGMKKFQDKSKKVEDQLDTLQKKTIKKFKIKASKTADAYEDEIQEISQEFTSENTSINSTKLPAVFKMVSFEPGTINIDYGGGKFDNVADYLTQYDVINLVYDPYNRSKEHNQEVISTVRSAGGADTATCSNVLNVIKEPEVRQNVLSNIKKLVKPGGKIYITVYEGSGKGNEGPTKSGYQLNRKTSDYLDEIQQVFPSVTRKGKLIEAINASTSIESSYDLDILIDDVLDIACSNINEQYGQVNTQIFGPSTNLPFDKFYITQYDVGTYIVYVSDNNIYVEDGETYELSGVYRSLDDFREFIQRLNNNSNQMYDENYSVNAADNLPGPGDFDPPEYDEPDELESTEEIEVEIDTDITMNEDGSWEYDDESFADGTGTNGTWYSEDYSNVYLGDHNDIVEDIDDILMQYLPDEPGRYHISGIATLVFTIGNIFSSSTYQGRDEDDDPIVDTEVYTEDADVTFDFGNSYISNFSCDKI